MPDNNRLTALIEAFVRINNKYNLVHNRALDYGTGESVHPSEIHFLNLAEKRPGDNISELGLLLGITKSAVSQTVSKLVRKNFCNKVKRDNQKNIYIELTEKGRNAVSAFREYKSGIFSDLQAVFEQSSEEKIEIIEEVFELLEEHMDRMIPGNG